MLRFSGKLTLSWSESGTQLRREGELVFDRASENLQWIVRGATTVTLTKAATGGVQAFENGVPRAPSPVETADFELVRQVVSPDPGKSPEVAAASGGYRVNLAGRDVVVSTIETNRGHGQR